MPPSGDKAAQKRLGKLLRQARVQQALKYKNRSLFAREKGLNERLLQDVETAYRGGFSDDTKLALEIAYGWEPGSIDRVLAGGDPVKAAPAPPAAAPGDPEIVRDAWGSLDFAPAHIQRIWRSDRWTLDQKLWLTQSFIDGDSGNGDEEQVLRRA
jgi:hypothetical protein